MNNNYLIENFHRDGYLIIENLFNHNDLDEYYKSIKTIADIKYSAILNPDRHDYLIAQSNDYIYKNDNLSERLDKLNELEKISSFTKKIIQQYNVVNIISTILKSEISYLMSQMLFKEAFSYYSGQAWSPHQDNSYIDSDTPNHPNGLNTQYITTNLFFDNANKENGSLYVYPGSHKLGKLKCDYIQSYRESENSRPGNQINPILYTNFDKLDLEFKKGSLLIINGNLIHGSYPNTSNKSRPLLSASYISRGSYFFEGKNAGRKENFIEIS